MKPFVCSSGKWPWNTYGVPQHANLRLLLWVSIDCIKWDQRLLDYPWKGLDYFCTMRYLVSAYPCRVLQYLPDLCRCRIRRISRVIICFPFIIIFCCAGNQANIFMSHKQPDMATTRLNWPSGPIRWKWDKVVITWTREENDNSLTEWQMCL